MCAGKRSHTQKAIAVGKVGHGGDSDDEIEMAELGNMSFGNPMKELEEAKRKAEDADLRYSIQRYISILFIFIFF